jgi:hypothetical protein
MVRRLRFRGRPITVSDGLWGFLGAAIAVLIDPVPDGAAQVAVQVGVGPLGEPGIATCTVNLATVPTATLTQLAAAGTNEVVRWPSAPPPTA